MPNTAATGALIAEALALTDQSQQHVADTIGVSQKRVSDWARGAADIKPEHRAPLEKALGLPEGAIDKARNSPPADLEGRLARLERLLGAVVDQLGIDPDVAGDE